MRAAPGIALRPGGAADRLAHGHPWVWRETIARGLDKSQAGQEVQVVAADGTPVGRGLADPASPIAVRLWTRGQAPIDERPVARPLRPGGGAPPGARRRSGHDRIPPASWRGRPDAGLRRRPVRPGGRLADGRRGRSRARAQISSTCSDRRWRPGGSPRWSIAWEARARNRASTCCAVTPRRTR